VFRFGTTPELIKMATAGALFDLGVVPRELFEDHPRLSYKAARTWMPATSAGMTPEIVAQL
jgi:hypothetical protein